MYVRQFLNKNQFIITDEEHNKTTFQSYKSTICTIDDEKKTITFGQDWDYSQTTLKHLYAFLEQEFYKLYYDYLADSKNKRASLQKAIDNGKCHVYTLIYDESL